MEQVRLAGPGWEDAIGGADEVARLAPQPTPLPKGVWKELRLGRGFEEGRVEVTGRPGVLDSGPGLAAGRANTPSANGHA